MPQPEPLPLEDLATSLGYCADALRRRRLAGIRERTINHVQAQTLMDQESELRLRADRALMEAAQRIVLDMEEAKGALKDCISKARECLDTVEDIGKVLEVAGDLLVLGAALQTGKPNLILAAYRELVDGTAAG